MPFLKTITGVPRRILILLFSILCVFMIIYAPYRVGKEVKIALGIPEGSPAWLFGILVLIVVGIIIYVIYMIMYWVKTGTVPKHWRSSESSDDW